MDQEKPQFNLLASFIAKLIDKAMQAMDQRKHKGGSKS